MPGPVVGWIATGGETFIQPILAHLRETFAVKPVTRWPDPEVDLLWCEWCDERLIEVTAKPKTCPIVARLHSYEAFRESGDFVARVNWSKVDALLFVAEHVKRFVLARYPVEGPEIHVIPNGVDLDRFALPAGKTWGKKVAWVGGITFKKGPELFVQAAAALRAFDPEFEFHVAGELQQERYAAYFQHILPRLGLDAAVRFHGSIPPGDMPAFFQSMDYVLSTSPWEGAQQSVAEGIASGCIPLVHDWPGAEQVYPFLAGDLWRTTAELVEVVRRRRFRIEDRARLVPLSRSAGEIGKLVSRLLGPKARVHGAEGPLWRPCEDPLVSAAMIVRNEAKNLERCLRSIRDVADEVVVLDTGSADDTREIARRLGARVFDEPWQEDFSLHRNHSIEHCRGRWIFVIDGDEELAEAGDLRALLAREPAPDGPEGFACQIVCLTEAGIGEEFLNVRAFLREKGRYVYPVHNQLTGVRRVRPCRAVIRAHYAGTIAAKAARSLPMLHRLAEARPEDPHPAFFLCKTYRMLEDGPNTLRWARRCGELAPDDPLFSLHWVWHFQAAFMEEGPEAARIVLEEGLRRHPGLADLRHCRVANEIIEWHHALLNPGVYALCPQGTRRFLANLGAITELLGLPFTVGPTIPPARPREEPTSDRRGDPRLGP